MSIPQPPAPAKLVVGMIAGRRRLCEPLAVDLAARFGDIDLVSPWMRFDYTDYYAPEMGAPLFRRVFAFRELIAQQRLAAIKLETNSLEARHRRAGARQVNLDPGYLLLERFVLATGKNYSHRIYIGEGIYADLTLVYREGAFRPLPWTYPDYADRPMLGLLERIRAKYAADLRQRRGEGEGRWSTV